MLEKLPDGIGHALINQRAGMENVVYNRVFREKATARLDVRSVAFAFNAELPARFTADGAGVSPPLAWSELPPGTSAVALIVEDADAPTPQPLVHAIVVGLDGTDGSLAEGALNNPDQGAGFETGRNSFLRQAWLPPDPPPGHGMHRYVFQVFALGGATSFSAVPGRGEFVEQMLARAIGSGCLIGTYEREPKSTSGVETTEIVNPLSMVPNPL